ncbi:hypothetical protein BCR39DRAFT_463453 [Naematelia encephala]|uniref:RING-type domain-containing protein n=1 Tax=Naematelia encephala TaxID=71784 RepID=A0A1Y2BHV3_9TREE|nr:hypothetical protein BCR39DRAFT_463453 [Naematelia encephala]
MGNAPSHSTSPGGTPAGPGTATPTSAQPTSSSNAQPINVRSGNTGAGTPTHTAFHSGLTPPPQPPSPPPPSTPPLLPYGGHLSPQNPHALHLPQSHDYSKTIVTRLILEARLAPFYRGLEDWEETWGEEEATKMLNEVREKDIEENVPNSVTEALKAEREAHGGVGSITKKVGIHRARDAKHHDEKEESERRERRAYIGAIECPICFLNYPPNINTSRCCQQPICTECFVQMKRSEATITHLESDPACCPYCVESDFGVIYERPSTFSNSSLYLSESALATSPNASGISSALSLGSEDAELTVGPGMAPKAQEKMRRKSVSSKSKEVVTIDEIRPDWEMKLNAVKAAAARKASRRIVMRQVGDRLIPIGFTSARAPGTADFSMSIPPAAPQTAEGENGARRSGRHSNGRERDLEELMIMEAMRLSMIDHEEHQKKIHVESKKGTPTTTPSSGPVAESSRRPPAAIQPGPPLPIPVPSSPEAQTRPSAASKLLSKFGNRSRSGSSASIKNESKTVTFAAAPSSSTATSSRGTSSTASAPIPHAAAHSHPPASSSSSRSPPGLTPPSPAPVAPIVNLASANSASNQPGLPRLSLDMPALMPDHPHPPKMGSGAANQHHYEQRPIFEREDTDITVGSERRVSYAQLDSDED